MPRKGKDTRPFSGFPSREAQRDYHRKWREANKEQHAKNQRNAMIRRRAHKADRHRQERYRIAPPTYEAMIQAQDGRCAICREVAETTLHVDHCHASGIIRGLLCRRCNTGIGLLKDSTEVLRAAIAYLDKGAQVLRGNVA